MKSSPFMTPALKSLRDEKIRGAANEKAMTDLLALHDRFLSEIEKHEGIVSEFKQQADEIRENISRIQNLPPGEKGEPGQSIKGDPGKDADETTIVAAVLARIPKPKDGKSVDHARVVADVMRHIREPKDGQDAVFDEDALIARLLETMKTKKLVTKEHISGLETELRSIGSLAGKQYGKDTYVRGGGMTMSAGSNITLVPQSDGTVKINASGGGSGTNVTTQYQLTAIQSGSDVTIDLSQLTNFATFSDLIAIYRNNIMQTETLNFTVAGTIVTIFNADASEIFNATYSYA